MANILLTGGTGFIGQRLISKLDLKKHELTVLTRRTRQDAHQHKLPVGARSFYIEKSADIRSIFCEQTFDIVIHLATHYAHDIDHDSLDKILDANIMFGTILLESMVENSCTRLINTTSCAEFDSSGAYAPNTLYAASKRAFRDISRYYSDTKNLKQVDLVLYDNYGEGDTRGKLISLLCEAIRNDTHINLSPGEQDLNLIHVDDTTNAIMAAVDLCLKQQTAPFRPIYSVAPPQPISLKNLVTLIETIYDKNLSKTWGAHPYRENEIMQPWVGSTVPGWRPSIDLETGLKKLLF